MTPRCSCVNCQHGSRGRLPTPVVPLTCAGCGLSAANEPSVQPRADGIARCNDCERYKKGALTDEQLIEAECDALKALLVAKNRKYGNAAFKPVRIFSKASPIEQLLVRLDDKLSRISTMGTAAQPDEDTAQDFAGYLILLRVALKKGLK